MKQFKDWYIEHKEEMESDAIFLPYLVRYSIGLDCSFNPNEDKYRDKIFSILNKFGYGDNIGTHEGIAARKRMFQYVCEYYKWYKENHDESI